MHETQLQAPLTGPLVAVVIYEGLCTFEFGIVAEVFALVRPEMGADWYRFACCSQDDRAVRACGHVSVVCSHNFEILKKADIVIVPGWSNLNESTSRSLTESLQAAASRKARVVGICGGTFALADAGLLSGRRAATHWQLVDALARKHEDVHVENNTLYCADDNIMTSAGSAAGIDLCLDIVRQDYGEAAAASVARRMVVPLVRRADQAQIAETRMQVLGESERLAHLLEHAQRNLADSMTLEDAAGYVAMSTRTFLRRFQAMMGTGWSDWLIEQRLARAKLLLETTSLSIDAIAFGCGFGSTGTLRHHFRSRFSQSPSTYRNERRHI